MRRILLRAALRFYWRRPWQLALALAGISLGVAVYVGVDLANDSAARAFELSSAIVRGQTTHRLLAVRGDLDEDVYRELVTVRGLASAAPVVEAQVGIANRAGLRVPLLGVDPIQESSVRGFTGFVPGEGTNLGRLMIEPGTVLLPESLANELGATAGSRITLLSRGREVVVEVLGTVPGFAADAEAEPPILADIATAQELLGLVGLLSRIDLRLTPQQSLALAAQPPAGTILVPADSQDGGFSELAGAFRTNLTALGLLALVVGTFLIYGTMSFAIVQRRATLGVLRAIGLSQRELLLGVLVEALGLAVVATSIGLVLGHWLATALVELVLGTIGDLYFRAGVRAAQASPWIYVQGGALGLGATLLAALKPAIDAARAPPAAVLRRAELERTARRGARAAAWAAIPLLGVGSLVLLVGPRDLFTAFMGLFVVLAAGALLVPAATTLLMAAIEASVGRRLRLPALLAIRGVSASLSRTGVATAALAVAITTVNGVGLMISSFRSSLAEWLETTLTADLYVGFEAENGVLLDEAALRAIEGIEGIAGVSLARSISVPTVEGDVAVRAVRPGPTGWGLSIVSGVPAEALAALAAGSGIAVSERLMFSRNLRVGDSLALPTPRGELRLPIVGGFRDFNTGRHSVVLSLELYRRTWSDPSLSGVGVHLQPGAVPSTVEGAVRSAIRNSDNLRIRSSEAIERLSLEVFDRTFRITEVLRVLAALVAFLGVLSALLAIELERTHELGVLRALGFSPRDIRTTLLTQTGLLGAAAGLAAIPLGATLAYLLVHVINRRSFGWSMELIVSWEPLAAGLGLAVGAALLAGLYPAHRASRIELGGALREE